MSDDIFVYTLSGGFIVRPWWLLGGRLRPPHTHVVLLRWDLALFCLKEDQTSRAVTENPPRAAECVGEAVYVERALAAVERLSKP